MLAFTVHRNMPLEVLQLLSRNFQQAQHGREAMYMLLGQLADDRTLLCCIMIKSLNTRSVKLLLQILFQRNGRRMYTLHTGGNFYYTII